MSIKLNEKIFLLKFQKNWKFGFKKKCVQRLNKMLYYTFYKESKFQKINQQFVKK